MGKLMRSVGRFILFPLIPVLLGLGVLIFGWQVVQDVGRQVESRALAEERIPLYVQTATALSRIQEVLSTPEVGLHQADDSAPQWVSAAMSDLRVAQFETNTPRPTASEDGGSANPFATNTPESATVTPTPLSVEPTPAATLPPVDPGPLPTILYLPDPSAAEISAAPTAVPTAFPIVPRNYDLVNILLLGQDNEITGDSIARTDTMIIVSINPETNSVAMLNLPRDLYVYMPQAGMQRLNVAYSVGQNLGWDGGPFFYMRQVILYNFGINVHYYAMVDLTGFASLIDTLGGIELAVDCPIRDYALIGAEVPADAVLVDEEGLEYELPVGYYSLSGKEALWYARSRGNSDDFDRGRRQQQILRAAFRKAQSSGLLNDVLALPGLVNEGLAVVQTDLSAQDVLGLIPVALSVDPDAIQSYRFLRWYHTTPWQPPDGSNVQLPNPNEVFTLMSDFYTPPTTNQLAQRQVGIRVYNGTQNAQWDRVAAERLGYDGYAAVAYGVADSLDYAQTVVIDYTGASKGSPLPGILAALNVSPEQVQVQPDPNREADFVVYVGADYNSCTGFVIEGDAE